MSTPRNNNLTPATPGSRTQQKREVRSCLSKIRYKIQPTCNLTQYAYPCEFCGGWHKATKHEES